jgi:DNA-binding transcriptional ArsR family regulator
MPATPDMDAVFEAVARYFSLLSDPMRLRIMHAVCNGELTVGEVVTRTGGTQTNVSRHLNLMHERGALARRKEGSLVYYSAHRDVSRRVRTGRPGARQLARAQARLEGNDQRPELSAIADRIANYK